MRSVSTCGWFFVTNHDVWLVGSTRRNNANASYCSLSAYLYLYSDSFVSALESCFVKIRSVTWHFQSETFEIVEADKVNSDIKCSPWRKSVGQKDWGQNNEGFALRVGARRAFFFRLRGRCGLGDRSLSVSGWGLIGQGVKGLLLSTFCDACNSLQGAFCLSPRGKRLIWGVADHASFVVFEKL